MNKEILYAITPDKPRRHQNPLFGYVFLAASVVTAILTVVFFVLASKENVVSNFNIYQWLAYLMILATAAAVAMSIYHIIAKRKYIRYCENVYKNGEKYKANILDVQEKKIESQNNRVDYYYAIKYSFTVNNKLLETKTDYMFGKTEIEYYRTLNYFPILYDKENNQYLYFLYVEKD